MSWYATHEPLKEQFSPLPFSPSTSQTKQKTAMSRSDDTAIVDYLSEENDWDYIWCEVASYTLNHQRKW